MGRPKSKGVYVPLAAQYFMDDAILEAGADAELLFVRCLSFLASVPSDGFLTERQVRTIVGIGLRNVPKRLAVLVEVGLLEAVDGGFVARSWTKWNKTTEEVGRLLAKDRERKSRKASNGAASEPNSARIPDGIQMDSEDQNSTEQNSTDNSPNGESSSDAEGVDGAGEYSDTVKRLCTMLAERVEANGHRVGVVGVTWWSACERLMRLDGYTVEQIAWLIDWATRDEFWSANIRSMRTFRDKFSTLKAQAMKNPHGRGGSRGQQKQAEALALVARYEEEERREEVGDSEAHGSDLGSGWSGDQRALGGGVDRTAV